MRHHLFGCGCLLLLLLFASCEWFKPNAFREGELEEELMLSYLNFTVSPDTLNLGYGHVVHLTANLDVDTRNLDLNKVIFTASAGYFGQQTGTDTMVVTPAVTGLASTTWHPPAIAGDYEVKISVAGLVDSKTIHVRYDDAVLDLLTFTVDSTSCGVGALTPIELNAHLDTLADFDNITFQCTMGSFSALTSVLESTKLIDATRSARISWYPGTTTGEAQLTATTGVLTKPATITILSVTGLSIEDAPETVTTEEPVILRLIVDDRWHSQPCKVTTTRGLLTSLSPVVPNTAISGTDLQPVFSTDGEARFLFQGTAVENGPADITVWLLGQYAFERIWINIPE